MLRSTSNIDRSATCARGGEHVQWLSSAGSGSLPGVTVGQLLHAEGYLPDIGSKQKIAHTMAWPLRLPLQAVAKTGCCVCSTVQAHNVFSCFLAPHGSLRPPGLRGYLLHSRRC
jgi:hypothetical protein